MKTGGLRKKNIYKQSSKNNPLFSVITVVYNGEKYIEQTIQSVLDQNYDNIEYIIIDGNSTDRTIDIIKKYEDKIDYWISEKDTGIYNAMNKGIDLCTGDYISFMNADDWYETDMFVKLKDVSKASPDYIFGNTIIIDENNNYLRTDIPDLKKYKRSIPFGHQALFVKTQIMQDIKFNEKYEIVADYDFSIKLITHQFIYKYIPYGIVNYRLGGVSSTRNYTNEVFQIHKYHFGLIHAIYWYFVRMDNPLVLAILKLISKPINFSRLKK